MNKIKDEHKVRAYLNVVGPKSYGLLKSLMAPAKPLYPTLDQLKELLRNHLTPRVSVVGDRVKFQSRMQLEHESIAQYGAELQTLAVTCRFGTILDESLRQVCVRLIPCRRTSVLIAEDKTFTFQKAVERVLALMKLIKITRKHIQKMRVKPYFDTPRFPDYEWCLMHETRVVVLPKPQGRRCCH